MLDLLTPYKTPSGLIRLGPPEDGGYVTPVDVLEDCSALMTYGVGHDERYEHAFHKHTGKPVWMFDHTIGRETGFDYGEGLNFVNEGLGLYPEGNCNDHVTHWGKYINSGNGRALGRVLLKVDIEGGEYSYFMNQSPKSLPRIVSGILLEVHWLGTESYRESFVEIMRNINKGFALCHVHGNNWGNLFEWEGYQVPDVMELTFINKDLLLTENRGEYPVLGLDLPNNPNKPDYLLPFLGKVL